MKKLNVAFLWHMHQPPYRDPDSGDLLLPWVRLHALKDYYDMGRVLLRSPEMHATVNFVPGLLDQLASVADGSVTDRYARVSRKPTSQLTPAERRFIVSQFFGVHRESCILPNARYRELLSLREVAGSEIDPAEWFEERELRDLQVWFDLAWSGDTLREDPDIAALFAKGRDFSESDKVLLAEKQTGLIAATIPLWQSLRESGRVELSTSAYYHPILPLLVRTEAATEAEASTPLPRERFRFPADARVQVERALAAHARFFGAAPAGMWPPEGSVSTEVLSLLSEHGVQWVATDEAILRKSIAPRPFTADDLCRPFRHNGVAMFFRDHGLSDRIGFVYSSWSIDRAVTDFIEHLDAIRRATTLPHPVVTVALDGENAWEYYREGGFTFLERLYERLSHTPFLEPTTFEEYLTHHGDQVAELPTLRPGSWIDGNFHTWIGDPAKNTAWDYLTRARRAVDEALSDTDDALGPDEREALLDTMLRAEASDWFWWLGEGHTSAHDWEFEQLFLRLLKRAYRLIRREPPEWLDRGIDTVRTLDVHTQPTQTMSPAITGRVDTFYKWQAAGRHELQQGSIHRQDSATRRIFYGFDDFDLYLRVDFDEDAIRALSVRGRVFEVVVTAPHMLRLALSANKGAGHVAVTSLDGVDLSGIEVAARSILEMKIPLRLLSDDGSVPDKLRIELFARLLEDGAEVERLPLSSNLRIEVNRVELALQNWFV